jgi:chondroitin-sulfate-ABC endolyase/exolyase
MSLKFSQLFFFIFLLIYTSYGIVAQDQSFENGSVPSNWSSSLGNLSTTTNHYKEGQKSLEWNWVANDVITISNAQNSGLSSSQVLNSLFGMFRLWVYNSAQNSNKITIEFYDNSNVKQFFYDFKLSYTGWRAVAANYINEMSGSKNNTNITTIKISAPKTGNGTLYLDFIDYTTNRNLYRNPDYQLPYINSREDDIWGNLLDFQSLEKTITLQNPTSQELLELSNIKNNYESTILGSNPSQTQLNTAYANYNNLNISYSNGKISGTPLYGLNFSTDKNIRKVDDFLLILAKHYKHTNNQVSLEYFINTIRYLLDQGYAEGSIMESVFLIGYHFRNVSSAIHLMKIELEAANLWGSSKNMVEWYIGLEGIWDENALNSNMDDALTRAFARLGACLYQETDQQKVQYLKGYKLFLETYFSVKNTLSTGIKTDFSGFHHNTFYPGYSYLANNKLAEVVNLLSDSNFRVNEASTSVLKKSLLLSRVISSSGDIPNSLSGRNPFLNPSFKYGLRFLGLSKPEDQQVLQAYNYVYGSDNLTNSYGIELPPNGFWQVNFGNLGIYRQKDWVANVKGFNKYLWGAEIYSSENRYGRYQSYGAIDIKNRGGYAANNFSENGWDWNKIPGTTTKLLSWTNLVAQNARQDETTDSNFASSLRFSTKNNSYIDNNIEGEYGVFGMNFTQKQQSSSHDNSFKFKKSVFFFDGLLICLGSDIYSDNGAIATNLFQHTINTNNPIELNNVVVNEFPYSKTTSISKDNWLIDANNIGYFIKKENQIIINRINQTAPNETDTGFFSGNFSSAYINHGNAPTKDAYEYVIIPSTTNTEMTSFTTKMQDEETAPYQVIQKDETAHIVKYNNIYGYVFFENGSYNNNSPIESNDSPCLVMLKESTSKLDISVVDPDFNFDEITNESRSKNIELILRGEWNFSSFSGGQVTISKNNGQTTLFVEAKDGLPTDISLVNNDSNQNLEEIIFYEDFRFDNDRGFESFIIDDGGNSTSNIVTRVSDVPDLNDSNSLFNPSEDRPITRIPSNLDRDQRTIAIDGDNGSVNFNSKVYIILTTLDLTENNPLISISDTYKYISFWTQRRFGDGDIANISLMISKDYNGNPQTATWTSIPLLEGKFSDTSDARSFVKAIADLSTFANTSDGNNSTLAFFYVGSKTDYLSSNRNGTFYISDVKFFAQSTTLSTDVNSFKNNILLYPNPVKNKLFFKNKNSTLQLNQIYIYNSLGKLLIIKDFIQELDVSNLSKGIYFVKITSINKQSIIKKIIISN